MKHLFLFFILLSLHLISLGQNCPNNINNSPGNSPQTIEATVYDQDGNIVETITCERTGNASPQIDCDLDNSNYPNGYTVVITLSQGQNSVDCVYDTKGNLIGALPVELTSFDVMTDNGTNVLTWITASERNNNYFTIEYSVDGILFEELNTIQGAGNASNINSYMWEHKPTGNSKIVYYRLSQTDYDGTTVDLGTKAVLRNDLESIKFISKMEKLIILNNSSESIQTLSIFDVTGKQVFNQSNPHNNQIEVNLIQNNVYFINVLYDNGEFESLKSFHK